MVKRTKGGALWVFLVKLVPNDMAVCFDHADSFELDHFDQYFCLIFWLKVNNDTFFEAEKEHTSLYNHYSLKSVLLV